MQRTYAQSVYAAAFVAVFLSACGGGGGGGAFVSPASQPSAAPAGQLVSVAIHGPTPTVIAYQTGKSGKWTPISASGGNVSFTLPVGTTAYSVAAMCPPNNPPGSPYRIGPAQIVIEATTSDATTIACRGTVAGSVNATMIVETQGFPNTAQFNASQLTSFGGRPGFSTAAGGDAVGSPLWQPGSYDFYLAIFNNSSLIAARILRNVTLTPNATMTLQPMSATTDAVTTTPLAFSALSGGFVGLAWVTAEGQQVQVGSAFGATTLAMPVIPAGSAQSGDYYEAWLTGSAAGQFVAGEATVSTPSSLSVPYPSTAFTIPTVTPADLPSADLAYNGFTVNGTRYYSLVLSYTSPVVAVPAGAPLETIIASQSYLGTSTVASTPDLSSVAGMLPAPASGTSVNVIGEDYIASGTMQWDNMATGNSFFAAPLPLNTQFQTAQSQGNIFFNAP